MDLRSAIVVNETHLPKLIHKSTYPCPGCFSTCAQTDSSLMPLRVKGTFESPRISRIRARKD
jgi:hypothetical protein